MKISFDFDGVLSEPIFQKLFEIIQKGGAEIFVITTRFAGFAQDLFSITDKLNIERSKIYFTSGEYKILKIKELAVDLHFDDDPNEIHILQENGINALLVNLDILLVTRFLQKLNH